ncbi:MAG: glycosyltransferase family 2 protein [Gammaproteobacteria bacterium]|nr:glycosyltransferase family 2 protein [Gammaproteobacteria bacterium]
MQSSPVLSVGIPVFNGSKWIEEAIGSILSQSFTDFELIICDNASSDETEKISRQAASADARIRYYRNATNIGVYANYDRVFELSTGRYFKWAACSDLCLQDFFEKCVAALDALPDAVLAYPRAYMLVTAPGTGEYAVEYEDNLNLEFERPSRRFAEYLDRERFNNVMNGVIRSSALRGTALNRPLPGSDISMIAELALRGKFVEIPDRLFVRRFNPETTGILMDSETSRAPAIGYPGKPNNIQRIRLHSYRFVTAFRAPISFAEKLRVWRYLLRRIIRLAPQVRRKLLQIVTPGG